jgi:hypothetical protein
MITHHLKLPFSPGNFFTKNITVLPHPSYSPDLATCDFSLFPQLKIRLKGCYFDTTEVIKEESQAVLRILREHEFQDGIKKMAQELGTVHMHERVLFSG